MIRTRPTPQPTWPGTQARLPIIGRAGVDAGLLGYAFAFELATRLRVDPPRIGPA